VKLILFALTLLGSPDAGLDDPKLFCEYADAACWRGLAQTMIVKHDQAQAEIAALQTRLKNTQRGSKMIWDRALRCEYTINAMADILGFKKSGAK
jgi:hypothetical protein